MQLPSFISEWVNDRVSDYGTAAFINLNASKLPWDVCNKKMNGAPFYYSATKGNLSSSIIFLTVASSTSMTVWGDKNKIKDPKLITTKLLEILEEQCRDLE